MRYDCDSDPNAPITCREPGGKQLQHSIRGWAYYTNSVYFWIFLEDFLYVKEVTGTNNNSFYYIHHLNYKIKIYKISIYMGLKLICTTNVD